MSKLRVTNPTEPPPEANTRLTFGVEIEFLLATVKPGNPNHNPNDTREVDGKYLPSEDPINFNIADKLTNVGIPAVVEEEDVLHEHLPDEQYRTCWILKPDCSVGEYNPSPDPEDYVEYGLEMSSPPYYYDEASREAIRTVIKTLRNNYLVHVDDSAGLHVHVGNGYFGLQWRKLRNLAAIVWTYEQHLELIMPEKRVGTKWCRSLWECKLQMNDVELARLEVLNLILSFTEGTNMVTELEAWDSISRLGFNVRGLSTPFMDSKCTVEFRYHAGSLDPEAILHWVPVCIKIVEKACLVKDEDEDEFFERLRSDVEKPIGFDERHISTIDCFMWLGCPAQAYYYGVKMIADKTKVEQRIQRMADVPNTSMFQSLQR
ncbi:hypothetical protein SBOR_9721 [Sclerotinia borealis F-4128]|uniref:Amidoligase enzyme n=1 Tax=Sclerotinia borealis (strain F-4128) TaxID=1432307 RepID=W9C1Y7_SCLBF|nr:hypothetical protein SBOR_9721 [Sclerotinia borealis F-4128]